MAWQALPDGVVVTVRLTPKGGRDALEGAERMADGRLVLKARVRAAASEGAANDALSRHLAKCLGVPPTRVQIVAGLTSRIKRLKVLGDPAALAAALDKISKEAQ
jgi:uncharacterized protein YggU (UPF0235/DUF167 family)